jgi:transposase
MSPIWSARSAKPGCLVFSQSLEALRAMLVDVIEDAANELPGMARLFLQRAHMHWIEIELQIAGCDERISIHVPSDQRAAKTSTLLGLGPATASALVASVGDFAEFVNTRQFAAWLGLVPSQNSTGGNAGLGRITKRGDDYLRTLPIQGAKSAVMGAGERSDRISLWLAQLKERVGGQKTVVALANKNTRILWAVLTRNLAFPTTCPSRRRRNKPACRCAACRSMLSLSSTRVPPTARKTDFE